MSWVIDVLLLLNLSEVFDEETEEITESPALNNLNAWLIEMRYPPLVNLSDLVITGKSMQAIVCGGAFNFLNIKAFIESVEHQHWRDPANLQLLIQDESEDRFTLYEFNHERSLQRKN